MPMNIYKWRRLFGVGHAPGEEVWALVRSGMAHDLSRKADPLPSFGVEDADVVVRVWVAHRDPDKRRGNAPRYRVQIVDYNKERVIADESHETPASAAKAYRRMLDPYARIVANYRHGRNG